MKNINIEENRFNLFIGGRRSRNDFVNYYKLISLISPNEFKISGRRLGKTFISYSELLKTIDYINGNNVNNEIDHSKSYLKLDKKTGH